MKFVVVPELSDRCTIVIAVDGSVTPGLSALIAASFHFLILTAKILASVLPLSCSFFDAGEVVRHRDRRRDGREVEQRAALVRAELSGFGQAVGAGEVDRLRLEALLPAPEPVGS